jgi:thiol reductant ABC exporter CydC subunit
VTQAPLLRVLRAVRPLRGRLALGVVLGALAVGAGVALMATSGYLISKAAQRPPILSLTVAIVAVRFFGISRGVFRYLERLASHDAALRLLARLRVMFFERLEPLVPDGLPAGSRSGDLLTRFVADVDAQQHLFVRAVGPPLVALLVAGGAVLATLFVDPAAAVALAAALGFAGIAIPFLGARIVRASGRREAPARATLATEVLDLLESAPQLVVAGREDEAIARIASADRALTGVRRRSALSEGLGEALMTLVTGAALVAVVLLTTRGVTSGTVDAVMLGMVALLALASFEAVRPLPSAAQHLGATSEAAGRIFELSDLEPPVLDPRRPLPAPTGTELRVQGATVRLREFGPPVLDGVDLALRPGRAIALVGPSGAGKTTLAHLLVRFRDPDEGRILLDGHDLRDYRMEDVRATVLLSGQDAHLFATTIRENILLARRDATDGELREALRRAGALEWVETLPCGLDTHVGEAGVLVSGGQRQRIALARAFLSSASFVVFDEPTAHLDTATAIQVTNASLGLADEGRGVLVITHGLEELGRVDEVVRLPRPEEHEA